MATHLIMCQGIDLSITLDPQNSNVRALKYS